MRSRPRVLVVALVLSAGLALPACGSDASAGSEPTATGPERTDFGPPVRLSALNGEPIEVTLLRVVDPATASAGSPPPDAGKRYVAAELELNNPGGEPYADTPTNGAAVIGTTDAQWRADLFDPVAPGLGSLTLAPGASQTGWITFEVPEEVTLRTLRFVTDSGFGADAEWPLR